MSRTLSTLSSRLTRRQVRFSRSVAQKIFLTLLLTVLGSIPLWLSLQRVHSASSKSSSTPFATPLPAVSLNVPTEVLINQDFEFEVRFKNQPGGAIGYGPYVGLYFPVWGADGTASGLKCDGINFLSAQATFTNPPTVTVVPTYNSGTGGAPPCAPSYGPNHPFTGATLLTTQAPAGKYQLVVLELPFGSFDATQPDIIIKVKAHVSDYADAGTPLTIYAQGGFRYGADALDNSGQDSLIESAAVSAPTTPGVFTLKKEYLGPEDETATGPNFPHDYKITLNIADQQHIDSLVITDNLPPNLQIKGNVQVTIQGHAANPVTNCPTIPGPYDVVISPLPSNPGGTLSVALCSAINGSLAADDVVVTFDFYIPDKDVNGQIILDPNCKNSPVKVINDVRATGKWTPLDPRDQPTLTVTSDVTKQDHILNAKCLAIQKKVTTFNPSGPKPGDLLMYDYQFQVSDYFSMGDLVVKDFLSDGQVLSGPPALITVSDQFGTKSGLFPAVALTSTPDPTGGAKFCPPPLHVPLGGTVLTFNISQAMAILLPVIPRQNAGILTGGYAAGATSPHNAATGTIRFYAQITDDFQFPVSAPHDKYVDKDDPINNCVVIGGPVYQNLTRPNPINAPTNIPNLILGSANDGSATHLTIVTDTPKKTVFAVKRGSGFICGPSGGPCSNLPNPPQEVRPGDEVTFRIEKTIPSSDAEHLTVEDWLPLPTFDVNDPDAVGGAGPTFMLAPCPPIPPSPGQACRLMPTHTLPVTPTFIPHTGTNSMTFDYGNFFSTANTPGKIDLLITSTVTYTPFADGLYMTNELQECEDNTFGGGLFCQTAIAQVNVREPNLHITKGVVATDDPFGVFTPALTPSGTWKPFGTSCPQFNGTIDSTTVGGLTNSNLSNVDANDKLTFAIAIENTGGSPAFEIELADMIPLDPLDKPSCFDPDFSSLCITDGAGTPIPFTTAIGGHGRRIITFAPGFSLAPGSPANATGTNIAIITFNAQLHSDITPGCCDNTAQLLHYTSTPGGQDFVGAGFTTPFSDSAKVCVKPTLTKSLVTTSETHTAGSNLAIGEIARYRLAVVVPEGGLLPNFQVTDALPAGMKFLPGSARLVFIANGLGIFHPSFLPLLGPPWNLNGDQTTIPTFTGAQTIPGVGGATCGAPVTFNLGSIQNNDNDTVDQELIVIEFNALVCNAFGNQNGVALPNSFSVSIGGNQIATSNIINAVVVEPNLTMTKTVAPNPAVAGQTLTYTVQYTNNGTADAFDVVLKDTLPAGLTLGTVSAGCPVTTTSNTITLTCGQVPKAPDPGSTVIVTYQAVANPATCPVILNNRATLTWTSLPGPNGTTVNPTGSSTPGNPGTVDGERDGVTPLLTLNDYATTASAAVTIDCPCCLQVSNETLACNPNGTFSYTFTLTNLTGATVAGVSFFPSAGVTITPSSFAIPPLAAGASTTLTVTIGGPNAVSGATICFGMRLGAPTAPGCRIQHCVTLPTCQTACATPPPYMVGWWPLDEPNGAMVINDIALFNNQGVPKPSGQVGVNAPTASTGKVSGALYFTTGRYVDVPDHPQINFGTGDLSIDAWVRPTNVGPAPIQPIVDKVLNNVGYSLYIQGQQLRFSIGGSSFVTYISNSSPITPNVWTHVAVTVARPNTVTLYINGSVVPLQATPALPGSSTNNSTSLWIGESRLAGLRGEIGIDELELFNKALALTEVQKIYNAGSSGKCKCSLESKEIITCNPNGTFSYTFSLTNLTSSTVAGVNFASSGGVTITPSVMAIPPLAPGASTTITVTIGGAGGLSGASVCFTVGLVGPPPAHDCRGDHCVTLPNCSVGCAPRPPGLVAWWPMNMQGGAVNDVAPPPDSLVNNVGGSPAFNQVFGNVGGANGALFFGGPRVQVNPQAELDFGTGDFSMDAWIRIVSAGPTQVSPIVDKFTMPGGPGFAFYVRNQKLELNVNGTTFVSTGPPMSFANPTANTGPWYLVAVSVRRNPAQVSFYINGNLAGTFTGVPTTSVNNGLQLWIGGTRLNPGMVTGGIAIDELELFKSVVAQVQFQTIFHAGPVGKCP